MSTDKQQKEVKILILKWLTKTFRYENYLHSFQDQYINWSIYDGELSITFDSRVTEHNTLLTIIPKQFIGTPQHETLKIVNINTFYLPLKTLLHIEYPDIITWKLIDTIKHQSTEKGWNIRGEYFYTYVWEVLLSDNTTIIYNNQIDKMDMIKGDYIYNARIQERAFINYLTTNYSL